MDNKYNSEQDRVYSADEFRQFDRLNQNTNTRIPIFFCIDISGSMNSLVGPYETRLSLLSKVMGRLLGDMKVHPVLSERAVIGVITYNNKAVLHQPALDLTIFNIENATTFQAEGQTVFSRGLRRTLQAIDSYRDSVHRSDLDTFTPMMIFMTDGYPVGDSNVEIKAVYQDIQKRILQGDLHVFPIGISDQADMSYVRRLTPEHYAYQVIEEDDFVKIFNEIRKLFDSKVEYFSDEDEKTEKISVLKNTIDTGSGTSCSPEDFSSDLYPIVDKNVKQGERQSNMGF